MKLEFILKLIKLYVVCDTLKSYHPHDIQELNFAMSSGLLCIL